MMSQIDKVLAVAYAEVGTKEYPPGSNNVKYNTWFYGKPVSGDTVPWCATFIWCCFGEAGLSHLIPKTASCAAILQYAKDNKRFVSASELRPGDVVLYKFATNIRAANHVGIVAAVTDKTITAIEGNTSITSDDNGGAVMVRYRDRTHIVGGFRPKYEIETEEPDMPKLTDEEFDEYMARYEAKKANLPPHEWAKEIWERACAHDTATGQKLFDGTNPQGNASREQLAALFERLGLL